MNFTHNPIPETHAENIAVALLESEIRRLRRAMDENPAAELLARDLRLAREYSMSLLNAIGYTADYMDGLLTEYCNDAPQSALGSKLISMRDYLRDRYESGSKSLYPEESRHPE